MSAAVSCQLRIIDSSSTKTVNAFRGSDASQQVEFSEENLRDFYEDSPNHVSREMNVPRGMKSPSKSKANHSHA